MFCRAYENALNAAKEKAEIPIEFRASKSIYEFTEHGIHHTATLQVPLHAETISKQIVRISDSAVEGHSIFGADAVGLLACSVKHSGDIHIIDPFPARVEGIRLALRTASVTQDHAIWMRFVKSSFPNAAKYLDSFVSSANFDVLLDNINNGKITFVDVDLSNANAKTEFINYLQEKTGNSTIALLNANHESDLAKKVITSELGKLFSPDSEHFVVENRVFLEKRQAALMNYKENMTALMDNQTLVIRENEANKIQFLQSSQVSAEWNQSNGIALEIVQRDTLLAGTMAEAYEISHDLHYAFRDMMRLQANELTSDHVPLFDTLERVMDPNGQPQWKLTFVDSTQLEHPPIQVNTKAPIFERVSKIFQRSQHYTTAGSTALNLVFGVRAICHWIENGFNSGAEGISNKSLATAIELHFYANAVGLLQGLSEASIHIGSNIATQAAKTAFVTKTLLPHIKTASLFIKSSSAGRFLVSVGRFGSRALPVIGMIINAADTGFNIYELIHNEDPRQTPMLITNTIFSASGLVISIGAAGAALAGLTAVAAPLALIGLGIALVYIPVAYLVERSIECIEQAKYVGTMIKAIANEIKRGGYEKHDAHKFLEAPSYISISRIVLSSKNIQLTYGPIRYHPASNPNNRFTHWFWPGWKNGENSDWDETWTIPIDDEFRTLMMPHIPNYTLSLDCRGSY